MKTGQKGLTLIKSYEGLELAAYRDAVGVLTIGYGHTAAAGPPKPVLGMKITEQEAMDILARDLGQYEAAVTRALKRVPSQNQFDAMVSLCYNVGVAAFGASSVVRTFNAGDLQAAADSFLKFNKARISGKLTELKGLTRRRKAERALFLTAVAAPDAADFKEDLAEQRMSPPVTQAPPTAPVSPDKPVAEPWKEIPLPEPRKGFWARLADWFRSWAGK